MTTPTRIQRRRTAGWRAADASTNPNGYAYVARGTLWGNPWAVICTPNGWAAKWRLGAFGRSEPWHPTEDRKFVRAADKADAHRIAVDLYADYVDARPELAAAARRELAGRDLMCWCAPEFACHVDHLLAVANSPAAARAEGGA